MRVLYIGGTGEISLACVEAAKRAGHEVTVYNRGRRFDADLLGVDQIIGDFTDHATYATLASGGFDVVCQFLAFSPDSVERDIDTFAGRCGQYVFISTASAYRKPIPTPLIVEDTPLGNPFWAYSRSKAECEARLLEAHRSGRLPVTIVRPSHTYRERLPSTVVHGDHLAWRLLNGKPVIVHGDGESVWTLTHADDFARVFSAGVSGLGKSANNSPNNDRERSNKNSLPNFRSSLINREVSQRATDNRSPSWLKLQTGLTADNASAPAAITQPRQ